MRSHAILNALEHKTHTRIRYFCQVNHVGIIDEPFSDTCLFCLGEHSIFVISSDMQDTKGEIFYAHVERVVEQGYDKGAQNVLRIELSDDRQKGIPQKMTLITSEKEMLLKYLKCYWETDYMWRLGKISKLTITKEKIDLKRFKKSTKNDTARNLYLRSSNQNRVYSYKGYSFFARNYLNRNPELAAEYSGKDPETGEEYTLMIYIENSKAIETIDEDMRSVIEDFAENMLGQGESNNYWYVRNSPYMKRMNLVEDLASWKAWEVVMRSRDKDDCIVLLRRNFIPPLMDTSQEIYIHVTGKSQARTIALDAADSIFSNSITNEIYREVLIQKANALLLDEETAAFYQLHLGIFPSNVHLAYQFILQILKIINESTGNREDHLKKLIDHLTTLGAARTKQFAEYDKEPEKIIQAFESSTKGTLKAPGLYRWYEKVSRYLAYCVDGGLLKSKFTLEDLVEPVMRGVLRDAADLKKLKSCINYLLYLREADEPFQNDDLYSKVYNMLHGSGFADAKGPNHRYTVQLYVYNEKMLVALIESGYLQRELEISGDSTIFPKLLVYLLERRDSSMQLKASICREIMKPQEASDLQNMKSLLPHIMYLYRSKNYTLATLAATAMVNLSHANRENKQFLYQKRNEIYSRLKTKDQKLMAYSFVILNNLASEASRRRNLSKEIRPYIKEVLDGTGISNTNYSNEVISRSLQLATTLCKDHFTRDEILRDKEALNAILGYIGKNDDTEVKALGLLDKLCERNPDYQDVMANICLRDIVDRLKQFPSHDICKALVVLMHSIVNKNTTSAEKLISYRGNEILDTMIHQPTSFSNDDVILRKISDILRFIKPA